MNRERILEAMEYIDPALIEAADRPAQEARRVRWRRPAVFAACLCLVLAGTAVAAELSGLRVVEFFQRELRSINPGWEEEVYSGYTVAGDVRYFPISELSEEVAEIDREISQPTCRSFSSWADMEAFLGIKLMENPLLEDAPSGGPFDLGIPGGRGKYVLNLGGWFENCVLGIDAYGSFLLYGKKVWNHWEGGVGVSVKASLLTEHAAETGYDLSQDSTYYSEEVELSQSEYVTPGGLAVTIFQADYPYKETISTNLETGETEPYTQLPWTRYDARFALNGIMYSVRVSDFSNYGGREDSETVWVTLLEVLDGFAVEA